jgi:hypothetical protein
MSGPVRSSAAGLAPSRRRVLNTDQADAVRPAGPAAAALAEE